MLFTEEWLRQYCNPQLSTEELAETLTMAGLEVEEVTSVAPAFTGVVVAEVLTCRDHENSDHLHVCEVNAGTGETLQIVCGAPNVRAGIKVACATIGAVLPGDFKIKKSKLRGVVSMGMLCSARELGISEEHNGIWILPEDAPIGTDIREYARLDDSKIEIKLTPNRGDALSVTGVARDLHAVTGAPLVMPAMDPVPATCECVKPVVIEAPDLCGRFTGRVIRNLNPAAETPQWMRDRLERAGMRHISALVDISNYVMLELGRPTHFFDLAKLEGDRITVRWAREGESLKLLNEQTVELTPYYGVVCDGDTPSCIAGIMGGEKSFVSLDSLVESANTLMDAVHDGMYAKAKRNLDENIYDAFTLEEAKRLQQEHGGFIRTMWCGDEACEIRMKEEAGMTSRCIPFAQQHLADTCAICGKPAKKMIYWGVAY